MESREPSEEDRLMNYLIGCPVDSMLTQIRSMDTSERLRVVNAVKENRSGRWNDPGLDVLGVLMLLGDQEERRKAIQDFRQKKSNRWLAMIGEPWVIEAVARIPFVKIRCPQRQARIGYRFSLRRLV